MIYSLQNHKGVSMRVHKIHLRQYSLRSENKTRVQNLDKFFETKSYIRDVKPVKYDTEEMRLFNEHMQEVQRDVRARLALSEIEAGKMFFNA